MNGIGNMPIMNSGKLFQVRSKTEKSKFIGKGYSSIGPAKRAISREHNWAVRQAGYSQKTLDLIASGQANYNEREIENMTRWINNPWLDPTNFEIVEFAVIEKAVYEYTPPA